MAVAGSFLFTPTVQNANNDAPQNVRSPFTVPCSFFDRRVRTAKHQKVADRNCVKCARCMGQVCKLGNMSILHLLVRKSSQQEFRHFAFALQFAWRAPRCAHNTCAVGKPQPAKSRLSSDECAPLSLANSSPYRLARKIRL